MASESGGWLNRRHVIPGRGCVCGVVGLDVPGLPVWTTVRKDRVSRTGLGGPIVEGESPVGENTFSVVLSSRVAAGP